MRLDGPATLMLRSLVQDEHLEENSSFVKFKGLLTPRLYGGNQDIFQWCLKHGVEVVSEMDEIAPVEAFMIGYRTWERILGEKGEGREHVLKVLGGAGIELEDKIVDFLVRIGDRVPVSLSEDLVFIFTRDLYDKVLLFNMIPE